MTKKEKIISRLNKGFGFDFPMDVNIKTHQGREHRSEGSHSWYIADIRYAFNNFGCADSMTTCLKWKRWLISKDLNEIFEYAEGVKYDMYDCLIEKI